jgi:ABC-type uncharacterized transport system substrate-binding protein
MVNLRALFVLAAAIMVTLYPLFAAAHPHVFVYAGLQIVFGEKGPAGLRMLWIFDEMFSNMGISEFDQNGNRQFEPSEIEAARNGAFSYLRTYHYFTHIKIDGHKFEVNYVTDFSARIKESKIVYEFLAPCRVIAA